MATVVVDTNVVSYLHKSKTRGTAAMKMLHKEPKTDSRYLDKKLAKADNVVGGFISGATVGAVAGGVVTAGSGILPGAVLGGLVGAITPQAIGSLGKSRNGHKS